MSASLKIDYSELQRAMREYAKVSKADGAEIVNRFGRDVAYAALKKTPTATATTIGKYSPKLKTYEGRMHFVKAARKGVKKGSDPSQVTRTKTGKVAKRQKGGPLTQAALASFGKAKASGGYIKAGWFNAIKDMGGNPRSRPPKPGGKAALGHGKKATARALVAWIYNFSTGADKVGNDALQSAVSEVARSKLQYAREKLAKTAAKFSGRKNSKRGGQGDFFWLRGGGGGGGGGAGGGGGGGGGEGGGGGGGGGGWGGGGGGSPPGGGAAGGGRGGGGVAQA
ncbi:MAG: hypothetical protein IPK72_22025 [Candidatus Eisenbacteria bacterium]|nr:hypothetical protein [Candidatus Eisenbacteria bacterium]